MFDYVYVDDLQIHGGGNGLGVSKFSGLGTPGPRSQRYANPQRHGETNRTKFYPGRVFELAGDALGGDEAEAWAAFDLLKGAVALDDAAHVLRWRRSGRFEDERAIVVVDGDVEDGVTPAEPEIVRWAMTLVAADPRIYSDTEKQSQYDPTIAGVGFGVGFPLVFPLTFPGNKETHLSVENQGTFQTPPVFKVTGPVTNPIIENDTNGKRIVLQNLALLAGQELIVDVGARTVQVSQLIEGDVANYAQNPAALVDTSIVTTLASGNGVNNDGTVDLSRAVDDDFEPGTAFEVFGTLETDGTNPAAEVISGNETSEYMPVTPGQTVYAGGSAKLVDAFGGGDYDLRVLLWWLDINGDFLAADSQILSDGNPQPGELLRGEVSAVAPAGAAYARVSVRLQADASGCGLPYRFRASELHVGPGSGYADGNLPGYDWVGTPGLSQTVELVNGEPTSRPDLVDPSSTRWFDLERGVNLLRLNGTFMVAGETELAVSFRDATI